jgi:hypothetical protein
MLYYILRLHNLAVSIKEHAASKESMICERESVWKKATAAFIVNYRNKCNRKPVSS